MSLADLLDTEARRASRRAPARCKYARTLADLSDKDRAEIESRHDSMGPATLSRVMHAIGKPVSAPCITKHIRDECCCHA